MERSEEHCGKKYEQGANYYASQKYQDPFGLFTGPRRHFFHAVFGFAMIGCKTLPPLIGDDIDVVHAHFSPTAFPVYIAAALKLLVTHLISNILAPRGVAKLIWS